VSAALVAEVPAGVVTVTSTGPDDPAGDTAVKVVDEVTLNDTAAAEPNFDRGRSAKTAPSDGDRSSSCNRARVRTHGGDSRRRRAVGEGVRSTRRRSPRRCRHRDIHRSRRSRRRHRRQGGRRSDTERHSCCRAELDRGRSAKTAPSDGDRSSSCNRARVRTHGGGQSAKARRR